MAASEPFPEPSPVHAKGYWCGISTLDGDQREANRKPPGKAAWRRMAG